MDKLVEKVTLLLLPLWCGLFIDGLAGYTGVQRGENKINLVVPTPILEGNTLVMFCKFDVNANSTIYTVKWYKGSREIFRYQPREHEKKKAFPFTDIKLSIDINQSDHEKLVIKNIPMALRGNVSCEVTWEPSFATLTETKVLTVASAPNSRPVLTANLNPVPSSSASSPSMTYGGVKWRPGDKPMAVNFGDFLTLNCSSGPSSPPTVLRYYVNENDLKLTRGIISNNNEIEPQPNDTSIAKAGLVLKLEPSQFNAKKIRVKCTANITDLYSETSDEFIGELPQLERTITASGLGAGSDGQSIHLSTTKSGNFVWATTPTVVMALLGSWTRWCYFN